MAKYLFLMLADGRNMMPVRSVAEARRFQAQGEARGELIFAEPFVFGEGRPKPDLWTQPEKDVRPPWWSAEEERAANGAA